MQDKKQLVDYLHLYLGCMGYKKKSTTTNKKPERLTWRIIEWVKSQGCQTFIPVLRTLDSMTEDEAIELAKLSEWEPHFREVKTHRNKFSNDIIVSWQGSNESREVFNATGALFYCADQFQWLLKNHFDLFELIEYNLAINTTKLKTNGQGSN